MSTANRAGIVLPALIGMLVLIELLAVTTLAVAWQEVAVARERSAGVQAQLAGRSALARWLAVPHSGVQALRPGARMTFMRDSADEVIVTTGLERLTGSLFVLRSAVDWQAGLTRTHVTVALLLNGLDPVPLLARLTGALNVTESAELGGSALIDGNSANQLPAGWSAAVCQTWLGAPPETAAITALAASRITLAASALVQGTPPVALRPDQPDSTTFGALYPGGLAVPDRSESGTIEWPPAAADYFPFVHATGNLTVASGAGQGTLLVEGDLVLAAGVSFTGLVLVRGRLTLEPGSRVTGLVEARSAFVEGAIERSNCAVTRALASAPAFNRLQVRKGRAWIPVF